MSPVLRVLDFNIPSLAHRQQNLSYMVYLGIGPGNSAICRWIACQLKVGALVAQWAVLEAIESFGIRLREA